MEFEFDKEIDSLLRQTAAATGESVQTFAPHHLDADEISLFAENALTTKARTRATAHLAECAKCRKILSNLISFNAEAESETIHAEESSKSGAIVSVAPVIPWYKRVFAFPQITFAMGALVLVFAGIIAIMVLQNAGDMQNATVARREEVSEKSRGTGGASSDGETQTIETYSGNLSNSASVNPAAPFSTNAATANTTSNSAQTNATTSGDATMPAVHQQPLSPENNEPAPRNEQEKSVVLTDQGPPASTPNATTLNKPAEAVTGAPAPKDVQQQRADDEAKEDSERKREVNRDALSALPKAARSQTESGKLAATKKAPGEDKNKAGETRAVGGKTFRNVGGIWFDSAYASQQQVMIRRGSDDYKRLDSGLRSIAENLSGTVVVIWKGKAYRIN